MGVSSVPRLPFFDGLLSCVGRVEGLIALNEHIS